MRLSGMALSTEDLAAIGQLLDVKLDAKLAAVQAQDRRRRRFWLWFWIAVFVISNAVGGWMAWRLWEQAQTEVARINVEFSESKLAYQRALQESAQLREERARAEKSVHYDSTKTDAQHEAGLISSMMSLLATKDQFTKKYDNADFSDPEVLDAYAKDLNRILDQGLNPLGQIMLRNTDVAHNAPNERTAPVDGNQAPPTPLLEVTPAVTAPTVPAALPAPSTTPAPAAPALEVAPR
jgi:hypothetical protein